MTQIFTDYNEFLRREDKNINGVSPAFAEEHANWQEENETNKGCWNCSRCSRCSGCSGCSDCSDCSGCSRCSDCSDCYGCYDKEGDGPAVSKGEDAKPLYPVIENIHQKVLDAASMPAALNMSTWHTCDTTHCRAGWVTHLAGPAGKELERNTSTLHAAMMIYKSSSPIGVAPTRFFESNEVALADMKRCAELERQQSQP